MTAAAFYTALCGIGALESAGMIAVSHGWHRLAYAGCAVVGAAGARGGMTALADDAAKSGRQP